ncbi:hypothetical protein [Mycolicibacterium gilvum]|uniref:Uncharacterized protein n=1 Tax=Mycolicibacterium gilvum (strain DSM 45189 / LMG 24558 / Spyr1) TaxID=278137 RepID=E6TNI4_MYCSR|nr:hypothetical protein [Mycolicibacterium gilvum]ADU01661.1 hypothetical protein Mspyr1_51340 [Mycolicibacterium gilvum Spyr1]
MGLVIRLAELLLILLPLIGVGYATVRAITSTRGGASGEARGAAQRILDRAVDEHDRTDTRWLDYELDAATLLDHPMVTDMREPLTQRFHRAKLRADLLRPARAADLVDDREATRDYVEAVQEYTTSFDIAEAEAMRRRRDGFSVDEQGRIDRAQRLLRVAADASATRQEWAGAYRVARRELDGLIVLPARARAALERGISGELT